jgi:putative salt-induced outer membrane protein YdiY
MKTILLMLLATVAAFADQVTMKNGDQLSGSILKSDTKALVMKTEFAGTVTIAWDAVTGVKSDGPLYVGLKDSQILVGPVETAGGAFVVRTQSTGTVNAAKDLVTSIRNKEEQTLFETDAERLRNPRLIDLWAGFLDLGYATSRGNSNTQTFTLNSNATRATSRDKIGVYYTSIFASSDADGLKGVTTANSKRGGINYNLNMNKRTFVFGSVDLETDQFQKLDLRFVPAGGLGYHAITHENTQFDLFGGAAANREFFSTGLQRTSAEILLGEELVHKLSGTSSFREKLVFFPNVSDGGNYRMNFDMSLVTAVRKWFSWQFTVSDRYLSNPVPGRKSNDVLFSTGLRLTFAK